ncbi:hypothetical protein CEXT_423281 [Caerostris extrusa]|uniref:Uncharacterized protein n=1 Tax=Caerostris extrusa TaxID=172846 RepID=A0AAV4W0R1_CAEEX|nr:hypothetical protein CEXT_423281 [Caerostris extrusa]
MCLSDGECDRTPRVDTQTNGSTSSVRRLRGGGSTAVLRCHLPTFVKEYVSVDSDQKRRLRPQNDGHEETSKTLNYQLEIHSLQLNALRIPEESRKERNLPIRID